MIRAIKLDPQLYEEVEADRGAIRQALIIVILVSLAAPISRIVSGDTNLYLAMLSLVGGLVGWGIWAFLTFILGVTLFKNPRDQIFLGRTRKGNWVCTNPWAPVHIRRIARNRNLHWSCCEHMATIRNGHRCKTGFGLYVPMASDCGGLLGIRYNYRTPYVPSRTCFLM